MAVKWDDLSQDLGCDSTKEMLVGLYHTKKMTSAEISRFLKIPGQTVLDKMKALSIPIRTDRSSQKNPRGT
jgi:hypothetical protein